MFLVTGGSASGKSVYAENQAAALAEASGGRLIYIATMEPWGAEGQERVKKHQKQRQGKGFHTIEQYRDLSSLALKSGRGGKKPVALLECISNLTANELFEGGGTDREVLSRITEGILRLQKQTEHLIIVTNEVFSDGNDYPQETRRYLGLLGQVNQWLAGQADQVTEVVFGIPVPVKARKEEMARKEGAGDGSE